MTKHYSGGTPTPSPIIGEGDEVEEREHRSVETDRLISRARRVMDGEILCVSIGVETRAFSLILHTTLQTAVEKWKDLTAISSRTR